MSAGGGVAFAQQDEEGWPREMPTNKGLVVIYQPQLDSMGGDQLAARAAVSVTPTGKTEPIFGTVWIEARVETDRDAREVALVEVRVPEVRFPDGTDEQQRQLGDLLTREMPKWELTISLDRLAVMLDLAERQRVASDGFDNDPPKIQVVDFPAILVTIDGDPQLREIEKTDFEYVVNTPFLIVRDPKKKTYYLSAGAETWYTSKAVRGPWAVAKKVPKEIAALATPAEGEEEPPDTDEEADDGPTTPPAIVVATEPSELIVTTGKPEYSPVAGGELLYVKNTESDLLMEVASQRHFVLLSGRWYASRSLEGPWSYVASDELPPSFQEIPAGSEELAHLRTWVVGTEEAKEAVLDAHIPQTATIKRDATIEVEYDGAPQLEDVEQTTLQYAVNTEDQVLKYGNTYYCAREAVWYVAGDPKGPWRVATEVPDEIQKIPASNPNYNVKYVQVYDSTPEVVYVGYYPGYMNSYVYGGSLVYGTGWYYRPWVSPRYYYPRHSTWGFHVRWNPWRGWGFGFSYSTGRFTFSMGFGGWRRGWGRGWWGPRGYRGYRRGYNRGYRRGARAGYRAGSRSAQRQNAYRSQSNAARTASPARASGASGARPTPSSRPNNVVSDRAGNVSQRTQSGSWQNKAGSSTPNTQSLNRTQQNRQQGSARTSRSRGGGGRRGGGGGRR